MYLSMSVHNFFSICFEVSTKLDHNTVQTNKSFHQTSSPAQFKMATRLLLFPRHPIPSAIAKYTPYEPYTTYFDGPLRSTVFTTALIRLRRLKIGSQCVQNRRSVGSSRKESKRGVRVCMFDNIQASVTASCSKSAVTLYVP